MNEQEIQTRLRQAEPAFDPETAPAGYGERIRGLSARRARRRGAWFAGVAGCLAFAAALAVWRPSREQQAALAPPEKVDYAATLAALREAADDAQAVADAIRARRKLAAARGAAERSLTAPDPLVEIKLQVEATAARRFAEAERAAAEGDVRGAAHSYERVVTLFPSSRASALAQERLAHLHVN